MKTAYRADVFVTLKRLVNDPEGIEILHGLHNLGYDGVERVRSGKFIQVWLEAASETEAQQAAEEMCERLLSNTVIEDYRVDISQEMPKP
jgi:phosphoribosylformylglycinamidine synthase PurS subunit